MLHARGDHKVIGLLLLHDQPHTLHIVLGIAPITQGVHVAKLQMILQALGNAPGGQRDLAGNKIFAAAFGFVVEQNAVHGKHSIGLAVFFYDPKAVLLCHGIGAVGVERRGFTLGHFLNLAIQFAGGCLIHAGFLGKAQNAAGLENAQHTQCIHIAGIFGHIKAHLHMALCCQIVNFIRLHQTDDADQTAGIRKVAVMQRDPAHQMIDARRVGNGSAAGDAVHLVAFFQQKFCQIRAILTGDAGDQCFFHINSLFANTMRCCRYFFSTFVSQI